MGGKIKESTLLKALNELEDAVEKGDALQNQDPDGGLATEGKPLTAGKGEKVTMKAQPADDDSSSEDEDDSSSEDAASDADSDSGDEEPARKCSAKKAVKKSETEETDEVEDESVAKSLRERADGDEEVRKGIEVSSFLEALVDQQSATITDVAKMLTTRLAKSEAVQSDFNARLAKALVQIGNTVEEMAKSIQNLAGQPAVRERKSVLNKSEVVQPSFGGQADDGLGEVARDKMVDWLVRKSAAGEIDMVTVTVFEQNGYNPEVLPPHVRKALVNDLVK